MEYSITNNSGACQAAMNGEFSFNDNPGVRKMIGELEKENATSCVLDMSGLNSIDSAGLGMILLINDAVKKSGKAMSIRGASGQVLKMLDISRFSDIVTIE